MCFHFSDYNKESEDLWKRQKYVDFQLRLSECSEAKNMLVKSQP